MRYNTIINNVMAEKWGLNLYEAAVFAWLYECQSWADTKVIDGTVYYFASRHKAVEELPMVTSKPDTMYRHYKTLSEKGLIQTIKIDGKEMVCVTPRGKEWNKIPTKISHETNAELFGQISEGSEKNPSELGKISEPSYYNSNKDNVIAEPRRRKLKEFIPPTIDEVVAYCKNNGYSESLAEKFYKYYEAGNWHDQNGKKVVLWKQKLIGVWFPKEEQGFAHNETDAEKYDRLHKIGFNNLELKDLNWVYDYQHQPIQPKNVYSGDRLQARGYAMTKDEADRKHEELMNG